MYLKNIAAAVCPRCCCFPALSAPVLRRRFPRSMTTRPMPPLWRRWPPTGLAAASATSLQAADGLQLAKEAGLLDDGSGELSLTELTAQALLRETEALQKQNFLETYDGVLVSCDSYISLRKEPSTDAARLRTIFDGKVAGCWTCTTMSGTRYPMVRTPALCWRSTVSRCTTPTTRAPALPPP